MAGGFPPDAHWRDSGRSARFWIFDARAAFPLVVFLMHIRIWTFALAMLAWVFFSILNRYGFTIPVFFRWLRAAIAGRRKMSRPWWM
jgi:intracellular multiplication protein IcmT